MDSKELAYFADLDSQIQGHKDQIKALEAEKGRLEARLIEEMALEGIQNMKVNGRTIYIQRQTWAGHFGDKDGLCQALIKAGMQEYVSETFNTNQLSAFVREFDPENTLTEEEIIQKLPIELQDKIKVTHRFNLRTRKA